jgi:hypothetical protein
MNIQTTGDMLAIPFFIIVLYYIIYEPKNKYLKYISIAFLICAIIADSYFVFIKK